MNANAILFYWRLYRKEEMTYVFLVSLLLMFFLNDVLKLVFSFGNILFLTLIFSLDFKKSIRRFYSVLGVNHNVMHSAKAVAICFFVFPLIIVSKSPEAGYANVVLSCLLALQAILIIIVIKSVPLRALWFLLINVGVMMTGFRLDVMIIIAVGLTLLNVMVYKDLFLSK